MEKGDEREVRHDVTLKGLTLVVANFEFGGKECRIPLGAVEGKETDFPHRAS